MKKIILAIVSLFLMQILCIHAFAVPAEDVPASIPEEADILAVFAGIRKQPHPTFTTDKNNLDTFWILFTNGEFRQYVIMDDMFQMYSCGSFAMPEEGGAIPPEAGSSIPPEAGGFGKQDEDGGSFFPAYANDYENIRIFRTQKYMEGAGFRNYTTIHSYILNGSEYVPLVFPGTAGRSAVAVYGAVAGQPFTEDDGEEVMADSFLILYSDGSFEQFVETDSGILSLRAGDAESEGGMENLLHEAGMVLLVEDR